MPKYKVNRGGGYPVVHEGEPKYRFGDEFESNDPADAKGAEQGYLLLDSEASEHAFVIDEDESAHDDEL